jgi:hypothetical protein
MWRGRLVRECEGAADIYYAVARVAISAPVDVSAIFNYPCRGIANSSTQAFPQGIIKDYPDEQAAIDSLDHSSLRPPER